MAVIRRLKFLIEYDGTQYHGWQVQPRLATVQGTLEACLSRMTNAPIRLYAAGRTDAGVHARGQVAHGDTTSTIALPALRRGLNSLLPHDIVVRHIAEVSMDFHARYSAVHKTYAYLVSNQPVPSAFWTPYVWYVPQPLDHAAICKAGRVLVGCHDFSAFRAASCGAQSPVRHLRRVSIKRRA
jgi:tRNA pseudouridine38-40 synthase